jgi:hypothetical protein
MPGRPRLVGFELYFHGLEAATAFYRDALGPDLTEEMTGHHATFWGRAIPLPREGRRRRLSLSRQSSGVYRSRRSSHHCADIGEG